MGLVEDNKRFLAATVDTPGSTHETRFLRHRDVYRCIINGIFDSKMCEFYG